MRWLGAGFAAGLLAAAFTATSQPVEAYTTPNIGKLDWSHDVVKGNLSVQGTRDLLEPCAKSKKFAKRIKDELYKVEQRQGKYPEGSVVYNRFVEQAAKIKRKQASYGQKLCGKKDGLPRTLSEPTVASGNTNVPAVGFFYTTGWIGWAGRTYIRKTKDIEKELKFDVPLALQCMASGFVWPVQAWQEIVNGEMTEKDHEIWKSVGLNGC